MLEQGPGNDITKVDAAGLLGLGRHDSSSLALFFLTRYQPSQKTMLLSDSLGRVTKTQEPFLDFWHF